MLKKINVFLLFLVVFLVITYMVASPPSWVIYKQLSAVRTGNLLKAYGYTSPEFQSLTSFDDFSAFLEQTPTLKNSDSFNIQEETETLDSDSKNLTVKGVLKDKEGIETPVVFEMKRSRNLKGIFSGWKINTIKTQENGIWKTLTIEEDVDSSEGR